MASPTRFLAVPLAAIALLVAGCGEEGDAEGTAAKTGAPEEVTKARYIEQGDAACIRHNREIQRGIEGYVRRFGDITEPRVAAQVVNRVLVPRMGHEIRTVRAFVLPPENVKGALRVLAAMQEVVDRAVEDPVAFVKDRQPFARPEFLGMEFGFYICGGLLTDPAASR
jgi:hypothetical protein